MDAAQCGDRDGILPPADQSRGRTGQPGGNLTVDRKDRPTVKVCAVPFRRAGTGIEVLAFVHPLAGRQFVKGSLEHGEAPLAGALRELEEESGLVMASPGIPLGDRTIGDPPLQWVFYAFETEGLPDSWEHRTADDGGRTFAFFWHPLASDLDDRWHPVFHQAYAAIRSGMRTGSA